MNKDELIIAQAEDKVEKARDRGVPSWTGFLDMHQQSLIRSRFRKELAKAPSSEEDDRFILFGGYDDAERRILLCLPPYISAQDAEPLKVARVRRNKDGGRALRHADYLGSLTGLGITRDNIGDILVTENGADVIVLSEMADYLLTEYSKAARVELTVSIHPLSELIVPEKKVEIRKDTVASLRLDNVVSSAFGISRSSAKEAISRGLVFLDHVEILKQDKQVEEGMLIVMRHKGRCRLSKVGGSSKKGRIYVEFEVSR